MTDRKKGVFIVKSQHPWQKKAERHTFQYSSTDNAEAEAKARLLIKVRAARGWDCSLLHEVTYEPEDHPASFKMIRKANPDLDMPLEDYLVHSGARYVEPFFAFRRGSSANTAAVEFNVSPSSFQDGIRENGRILRRRERLLLNRYDNIDLRRDHREAYLVELNRMMSDGQHDKIPLFFTAVDNSLVRDLASQGLALVSDLEAAKTMITEHPQQWMSNDLAYICFALDRIAEKAWEEVFWFLGNPMGYLDSDPTFVPLTHDAVRADPDVVQAAPDDETVPDEETVEDGDATSNRITKARQMKSEILKAMEESNRITDRDRIIVKRVLEGEAYRSVAKDFGIGAERVRGICFCTFRRRLGFDV